MRTPDDSCYIHISYKWIKSTTWYRDTAEPPKIWWYSCKMLQLAVCSRSNVTFCGYFGFGSRLMYSIMCSCWTKTSFGPTSNAQRHLDTKFGSVCCCLKADIISYKPTSGTWHAGLIVQVLGQVQSHSWLPWAQSFTHLWPINTASANITVSQCDLCLTLVNWGNNREAESSYYDWSSTKSIFLPEKLSLSPRQRKAVPHLKEFF